MIIIIKKIELIKDCISTTNISKVFDSFGKSINYFYRKELSSRSTYGGLWDIDQEIMIGVTKSGWAKYEYNFNFSAGAGVKNHVSDEILTPLTVEEVLEYSNKIPELKEAILNYQI